MTAARAIKHQLSDLDPGQVVPVDEACRFLGISRPTLYRLDDLRRVRLSPGRVGYRVGDLLEHGRRGQAAPGPFSDATTVWVDDHGGALLPDWFLELPVRVSTIVRRRPANAAASLAFSVELPPAKTWAGHGHRELLLIDYDGLNAVEPMVIVPQEDEYVGTKKRLTLTLPHATVRLVPLFGWPEKMPDGWWIA